jgi:hypothetical protein
MRGHATMNLNRKMNNSRDENLKRIIHLMQTDGSVDAPADAIKWSKDIFRTRAAERKPTVAETVLAVLKMDLAPGKAVFGERSGTAEARQMLFEAGPNAVDLRISASEEGFVVRGQVLGEGFENCDVSLGDRAERANDRSEFVFKAIRPGVYDLVLNAGGSEIAIEKIEIS